MPWSNKRVSGKIVESETGKEKVGPERHSQNSVSKDLDSDDDEEEEEEEEEVTGGRVIHFHHTKSEVLLSCIHDRLPWLIGMPRKL